MKQLSKKEYKYRYKVMYENHLNKKYQMGIDKYIDCSYEELYRNKEKLNNLINKIATELMCKAMRDFGDTAENVSNALKKLSEALISLQ